MKDLRLLWRRHRVTVLAFGLALAVALFFAVRLILSAIYWADPSHRDQHPEAWMTPGYVAHSWHVPREALVQYLDIPPELKRPATIEEIARARGVGVDQVIREVEAALAELRASAPPPGGQ
ncbi:hypothetical protein LV82_00864 [Albidovulum inexpectatum]|uniref:Uncharacterized protein n=1 Tax=Albidovulum inexpectatum TaxID=196587 RepID=A0A2S5JJN5_9RHOB|nr:hypothetical protein [Albidovulum inexpectatum]PPB81653.1 hypothetical protein LV82_00864 [Albidovulum inexpectatum]